MNKKIALFCFPQTTRSVLNSSFSTIQMVFLTIINLFCTFTNQKLILLQNKGLSKHQSIIIASKKKNLYE